MNRLSFETSPYLRQHAENPVDRFPWGEEALTLAKRLDGPIQLSIGYSSCYWRHVMARECFEDIEIAQLVNPHFVNVKVDREERPDLDSGNRILRLFQEIVSNHPTACAFLVKALEESQFPPSLLVLNGAEAEQWSEAVSALWSALST